MLALFHKCRYAVFADVIRVRPVALAVAGVGAAQLVASCFGCGLPCMFYQMSGKPCPGCGLTRSVLSLLHGNVGDSLTFHPFGPLLLLGLTTAFVAGVLPAKLRDRLANSIASFERYTALTAVLFILLMLMWVLRLCGMLPLKVL